MPPGAPTRDRRRGRPRLHERPAHARAPPPGSHGGARRASRDATECGERERAVADDAPGVAGGVGRGAELELRADASPPGRRARADRGARRRRRHRSPDRARVQGDDRVRCLPVEPPRGRVVVEVAEVGADDDQRVRARASTTAAVSSTGPPTAAGSTCSPARPPVAAGTAAPPRARDRELCGPSSTTAPAATAAVLSPPSTGTVPSGVSQPSAPETATPRSGVK